MRTQRTAGKETSPNNGYTRTFFKGFYSDTPLICTVFMAPLLSVLTGFYFQFKSRVAVFVTWTANFKTWAKVFIRVKSLLRVYHSYVIN